MIDKQSTATESDIQEIHDLVADISCLIRGFEMGIIANPNGNQEQRRVQLDLAQEVKIKSRQIADILSKIRATTKET